MIYYVLAIILVALVFDFVNGFHDSANSIATVVATRVLSPLQAVAWAAFFNFIAAFFGTLAVAKTIGSGMIDTSIVDPNVILGGLIGAIAWDLITWYYGLPSSSSHALIGGYAGAAVAKAGLAAITWGRKWQETLAFIVISPVVGMLAGGALMILMMWIFRRTSPAKVNGIFRYLQLISSGAFSYSHGANDAQKTMGIIVGLLVASQTLFAGQTGLLSHLHLTNAQHIPFWVVIAAHTAIGLGTLSGGWRIVHTMGHRVTRLRPVGGFCAETGGATAILVATHFGIPVSTTHTITGAITGVGAAHRTTAVRWGIAGRIVWAWILTIPASAIVAALSYFALAALIRL